MSPSPTRSTSLLAPIDRQCAHTQARVLDHDDAPVVERFGKRGQVRQQKIGLPRWVTRQGASE